MTMEKTDKPPPPGSSEAYSMGCKCPILDNGHGLGYMGQAGVFVYNETCPLHGLGDGAREGMQGLIDHRHEANMTDQEKKGGG